MKSCRRAPRRVGIPAGKTQGLSVTTFGATLPCHAGLPREQMLTSVPCQARDTVWKTAIISTGQPPNSSMPFRRHWSGVADRRIGWEGRSTQRRRRTGKTNSVMLYRRRRQADGFNPTGRVSVTSSAQPSKA